MSSIISFSKKKLQKLENELKNAYKTGNVRLYRVIQALIFIGNKDSDFSFDQIANFLNVTRKTIYNWLMKFMCGGFKWLKNDPFNFSARGRRPRLNKDQKAMLFEMVKEGPEKNGFIVVFGILIAKTCYHVLNPHECSLLWS